MYSWGVRLTWFDCKAEVYVLSRLPGVRFFQRRTRGKKIAQTFLLQPEL